MIKYRFKTEQELITEFGQRWNRELYSSWNSPDMDYLFGMELKIDWTYGYLDKNGKFNTNRIYIPRKNENDVWSIKCDLIKVIKSVDYNEKRILVYD